MNTELEQKLKEIAEGFDWPIVQGVYKGGKSTYLVYDILSEIEHYEDNQPVFTTYEVRINLYIPKKDYQARMKNQLKEAIRNQDASLHETRMMADPDSTKWHVVFEAAFTMPYEE